MVKNDASPKLRFTFKKEERLSSKKIIDELFMKGSSFYLYPFKVQYLPEVYNAVNPVQILVAVPSKSFPHAVDRNRIKRLIRETYRLNKNDLYDAFKHQQKKLLIALIYTAKKIEPFDLVNEKMISILNRLSKDNAAAKENIK
ncbi:MAG: ribonuclease P protein component [Chitinophagales bacterium]